MWLRSMFSAIQSGIHSLLEPRSSRAVLPSKRVDQELRYQESVVT